MGEGQEAPQHLYLISQSAKHAARPLRSFRDLTLRGVAAANQIMCLKAVLPVLRHRHSARPRGVALSTYSPRRRRLGCNANNFKYMGMQTCDE